MYVIEYKVARYPYHYEYLEGKNGKMIHFSSVVEARKRCINLIKNYEAVLAFVRPVDEGVYKTRTGGYVLEKRKENTWYHLNRNGTVGSQIKNTKNLNIIQSINYL